MQTHLKNFLKNSWVKCEDITNKIFNQFSDFKKHIQILFEDIDIEWTAEQTLINLQQQESAAIYAAEFQRIAFKTEWEDVLLITQFYRELKNSIKNDIMKAEWSDILQVMIWLTVQINNQQHECCMKKTRQHAPVMIMQRKLTTIYHDSYELQFINLDTTHRHSRWFKRTGCF